MEYKKKTKNFLGSKENTVSCHGNTPSGTKSWPVVCQKEDQYLEYMKNRKDRDKIRNKKTNEQQKQTKQTEN